MGKYVFTTPEISTCHSRTLQSVDGVLVLGPLITINFISPVSDKQALLINLRRCSWPFVSNGLYLLREGAWPLVIGHEFPIATGRDLLCVWGDKDTVHAVGGRGGVSTE